MIWVVASGKQTNQCPSSVQFYSVDQAQASLMVAAVVTTALHFKPYQQPHHEIAI